jgi:membrane-associated protease RseP (regulator of RpoE activity)
LDGGQSPFVLAEALTGEKVNQRLQEGITSVTVLFLLFVTLSTTILDVNEIPNTANATRNKMTTS